MPKNISRFIYWTPRILSILFIIFLALFSLDVFDIHLNFWQTVIGLLVHNIPALILLVILLISWKHEIIGGITFILTGILYIIQLIMGRFEWQLLAWSLIISGPALLIGILFLIGWFKKEK